MTASQTSLPLSVPPFVVVTYVGVDLGADPYTVSNEVSGKQFSANAPTVAFLEAVRATGSYRAALKAAGMSAPAGEQLLAQLIRFGVVVSRGQTNRDAPAPVTPLESRAIMIRFDLLDAAWMAARFRTLGRLLFGPFGFALWLGLGLAALVGVLLNGDKAALALQQVPQTGWAGFAAFVLLFVGLKICHEMGHALAYQEMCRREALDPGPIRMGISIFALTPFPYTNVTGAWRLRGRVPRAVIGAGGLYLEFLVVFVATLWWANTGSGVWQTAIFQVAMFATVSSLLFNLNPLVKLDGYYILSDLAAMPNLAGRGSQAAMAWLSRRLGAKVGPPARVALTYWGLSYLYRWVIFAGIFWLAYQVDPRLGVPVFAVVVIMLVLRPLIRSIQFARARGARPGRMAVGLGALAAIAVLSVIPLRDRVLLDGQLSRFETTFVRVPEPAQLRLGADGLPHLVSLDLDHQQRDLALRRALVESAARAVAGTPSGVDRARLQTDLAQLQDMAGNLAARAQTLAVQAGAADIWTPLAAEDFADAWVQPGTEILGALSRPVVPHLVLWLDQSDFEVGLLADAEGTSLRVRLEHDPACAFEARLTQGDGHLALQAGAVQMRASIVDAPPCLAQVPSGAGVVARKPTRPKSISERLWASIQRALQDRLPVEILLDPTQQT